MTYSTLESEYLVTLLRCAIKQENPPKAPEELDWQKLAGLSKKQQVYSVIVPVIDLTSVPAEIAEELQLYSQNELIRMLAMKTELEEIEKELEKNEIKFMLLKGSVIRNYYPLQKMRQMSDFDILYDYSKRDSLLKIMKKHNFRLTASCENSDDFFKEPFYTFEFHRELFFSEAEFCPHFDLWKNSYQDKEVSHKYHIECTDNFVYTICHMFKHYATNGCGIRFLCDIYVMMNYGEPIDEQRALSELEKIGIKDFALDAINLANVLFNGAEVTDNQQKIFDFMMSSGVYGNLVIDYSKRLSDYKNSKVKYLFSRLFPSKKKMMADYRQLEKKPYLLPVYYIIRLFNKLKYNSNSMRKELSEIKKIK